MGSKRVKRFFINSRRPGNTFVLFNRHDSPSIIGFGGRHGPISKVDGAFVFCSSGYRAITEPYFCKNVVGSPTELYSSERAL